MDFEEKMDALRMNLELASREIEALRVASANQYENIQGLMKISGDLVRTAEAHKRRISTIEGRI